MKAKDQPVFAAWLTGLPASGKSTLANLLKEALRRGGLEVQVIDSDELRKVLTPEPTYTDEERRWFYRTLVYIGSLLTRHGVHVLIAATGHRQIYRDEGRQAFDRFIEIYLECSLKTCMARDMKGIYRRALAGDIDHVPGVQELYEAPLAAEITVDTENQMPEVCLDEILQRLDAMGYFGAQV